HIHHPCAARVVTHAHHIVLHPDVMCAAFRYRVVGDLLRTMNIADIDHVNDTSHWNSFLRLNIEYAGKDLIADRDIILVAEDRVRPWKPAVAVEFVVVHTILTDQLRLLRTPPFDSAADIQNNQAVSPVSQVCEPVFHLNIVQVSSASQYFTIRTGQLSSHRDVRLPPRNLLWILYVFEIDNSHRPG